MFTLLLSFFSLGFASASPGAVVDFQVIKAWNASFRLGHVKTHCPEIYGRFDQSTILKAISDNIAYEEELGDLDTKGFTCMTAMPRSAYLQLASGNSGEIMRNLTRVKRGFGRGGSKKNAPAPTIPPSMDWRKHGAVTGVKQQGECGACWAFAVTGAFEGMLAIKTKSLRTLSEQNLIDCAPDTNGCNGGGVGYAWDFVKKNKGISTAASYPYKGKQGVCNKKVKSVNFAIKGNTGARMGDENDLKRIVGTIGPVAASIDFRDLQNYRGGIHRCKKFPVNDHGVLVVGYGTEKGQDYWLIKNSFGTGWGEAGYVRLARGHGNYASCGVPGVTTYPIV